VESTAWDESTLVEKATQLIEKQLAATLEKDIMDRIVAPSIRKIVAENRVSKSAAVVWDQRKSWEKGLEGLSFKKKIPKVKPALPPSLPDPPIAEPAPPIRAETPPHEVVIEATVEEDKLDQRPKKRRKQEPKKKKSKPVVEPEDEDIVSIPELVEPVRQGKRQTPTPDDDQSDIEPPSKKARIILPAKAEIRPPDEFEMLSIESDILPSHDVQIDDVFMPDDHEYHRIPNLTILPPTPDSSRSVTPAAIDQSFVRAPEELYEDDEDRYLAKMVLAGITPPPPKPDVPKPDETLPPGDVSIRVHLTGSARTEGYYKISHTEKAAYVSQYQVKGGADDGKAKREEPPPPPQVTSSRSNRANARRRAQGLEEINQVQRAVALSKGETANELSYKFNQLQTRKKHLRFARSPIHDWGLYAMERIARGEMVIEYVGEVIRAAVAEKREKAYERQGIGSSYLFRIDEDLVVDATMKGNLGYDIRSLLLCSDAYSRPRVSRLINHCCDPNCNAKIITIGGEKKIVIYAKHDIELGDEITYGKPFRCCCQRSILIVNFLDTDYHFPIEQDKIPCLCGSPKCRGFLN